MIVSPPYLPSRPLSWAVEYFQVVNARPFSEGRSIPNARIDAWVILEGSFELGYEAGGTLGPAAVTGICPMRKKPLWFRTREGFRILSIKFYCDLVNLPHFASLQDFDQVLPLEHFFPAPQVAELVAALRNSSSVPLQISHLETFLSCFLPDKPFSNDWLVCAMRRLVRESIPIEQLALDNCMSVKTLERRFQERTGFNPKELGKLARFQRAIRAIQNQNHSASGLAGFWAGDYYDQSHFIKECKTLTGLSPGQLIKHLPQRLPDVMLV